MKDAIDRPQGQSRQSGYKKFIQGEFGLAKTYWLFGVLVSAVVNVLANVIFPAVWSDVIFVVFAAYMCALLVAVFQAARKYQGSKIWSILAVLIVLSGVARTVGSVLSGHGY